MAKHDQRILKFLNQNADRSPTITDMMTKLNISISDISDSLSSLQGQGLISMKTNSQGIECWFPAAPTRGPQSPEASPSPWEKRPLVETYPSAAIAPVSPGIEESSAGRRAPETAASMSGPGGILPSPYPPRESLYATGTSFPGLSQPAPKTIGIGTFVFGLIAAVGLSAWLGGFMAERKIEKAASAFADKKTMAQAASEFGTFRESTNAQVAALETEVQKLSAELAAARVADSIRIAEAAKPVPVRNSKTSRRSLKSRTRSAAR